MLREELPDLGQARLELLEPRQLLLERQLAGEGRVRDHAMARREWQGAPGASEGADEVSGNRTRKTRGREAEPNLARQAPTRPQVLARDSAISRWSRFHAQSVIVTTRSSTTANVVPLRARIASPRKTSSSTKSASASMMIGM